MICRLKSVSYNFHKEHKRQLYLDVTKTGLGLQTSKKPMQYNRPSPTLHKWACVSIASVDWSTIPHILTYTNSFKSRTHTGEEILTYVVHSDSVKPPSTWHKHFRVRGALSSTCIQITSIWYLNLSAPSQILPLALRALSKSEYQRYQHWFTLSSHLFGVLIQHRRTPTTNPSIKLKYDPNCPWFSYRYSESVANDLLFIATESFLTSNRRNPR